MTVQEETETETASAAAAATLPPQKEENDAQVEDVEIGIDGDAADVMGTKEEVATATAAGTYTSTADEAQRTPAKRPKSKKSINRHASSDDPFAIREGKTLLWTDVNMVLVSQSLPSTVLYIYISIYVYIHIYI
jgi:hypothetical protein